MLEWNVYVGNFNSRRIEHHNIFDHGRFIEDCRKAYKKYGNDRAAFEEAIRNELLYYYWSKCEWEVVINHWPPHSDEEAIKVDVYAQVCMNWDRFVDYLWENRAELKTKKE